MFTLREPNMFFLVYSFVLLFVLLVRLFGSICSFACFRLFLFAFQFGLSFVSICCFRVFLLLFVVCSIGIVACSFACFFLFRACSRFVSYIIQFVVLFVSACFSLAVPVVVLFGFSLLFREFPFVFSKNSSCCIVCFVFVFRLPRFFLRGLSLSFVRLFVSLCYTSVC